MGGSKNVAKAEEMAKRHDRVIKRAIEKRINTADKLGKGSTGLAAVSLGSGIYALKKMGDAKKAKLEEK